MDFEVDMKKFQEDAKALENNLQRIREYVGRVNQLMAELSTGVKALVERGALDNTEKKINNDFMGYYKAVHNLEKHFGEIAEEIKAYDDKINASQYQRMDSLRIELKALLANQRQEQEKMLQERLDAVQKFQEEYLQRLENIQKRKETEAVDRSNLNNIIHLMESLDCDVEKALQLLKIPKRVRGKYARQIAETRK